MRNIERSVMPFGHAARTLSIVIAAVLASAAQAQTRDGSGDEGSVVEEVIVLGRGETRQVQSISALPAVITTRSLAMMHIGTHRVCARTTSVISHSICPSAMLCVHVAELRCRLSLQGPGGGRRTRPAGRCDQRDRQGVLQHNRLQRLRQRRSERHGADLAAGCAPTVLRFGEGEILIVMTRRGEQRYRVSPDQECS